MQASVLSDGLTAEPTDKTFGGRLDPENVLDCSAYQLWAQGRAGKRELKKAAEEMELLLEKILQATGREADKDMQGEAWLARNAVVAEERRYFLSDEWLSQIKQPVGAPAHASAAVVATAEPELKVELETKTKGSRENENTGPPLTEGVHPATGTRCRRHLDDHGRPIRNMYRDRGNRRLDLNDLTVGVAELTESVPLVGTKLAQDLVDYRAKQKQALDNGVATEKGAVVPSTQPIKHYTELLKKNGGVLPGDIGGKTFESLMCFTTV